MSDMPLPIPPLFLERLARIVPPEQFADICRMFNEPGVISVRINLLKGSITEAHEALAQRNICFHSVPWANEVLILDGLSAKECSSLDLLNNGVLYRQSLSSLLPVLALAPQPAERVLDFCAAPGSKTTQIAAMMKNQGEIVAIEAIKPRFYRLKSVCTLLGVENVTFKVMDGRRYHSSELFDRILVDAPCSSEGRFNTLDPDSFGYWSLRKIKEMVHKQRGLLLSASRLLKPGGVMVYSTCTFAPEENEGVVDWVLRKSEEGLRTEPITFSGVVPYPALRTWEQKVFSPEVKNGFRVLPQPGMEGFFMTKFTKA